ncbi:MAG TPA: hypothetical protein VJP78_12005 [Thermoleophilia bacterium]|nr:hypothetical protein [Thermoleophilia bacterium]
MRSVLHPNTTSADGLQAVLAQMKSPPGIEVGAPKLVESNVVGSPAAGGIALGRAVILHPRRRARTSRGA